MGTRFSWAYLIRCDSLILSDDAAVRALDARPDGGHTEFMSSATWLLLFAIIFLPLIVGYGRCLDHWRMTQIWLWLLLPVVGWFVSLYLATKRE